MKHVLHVNKLGIFQLAFVLLSGLLSFQNVNAQANLIIATDGGDFSWTSDPRSTYTYPSGDVINYLNGSIDGEGNILFGTTSVTTSTSNICDGVVRRVQLNAFELVLNSTSASKIVITGNSSGAGARYIRALYIDDVLVIANGEDTRVTAFHPGGSGSADCADIVVEGLNITKGQKVKILIGGSATGSAQNFRVNRISVTAGILPVRLLSFDAVRRNTGVEVTWRATNENEGRSYRVERSSNGQDFEVVNTVETLGAGSYSFLDKTQKPGRIAYYRLEMISVDGEKKYSKVKSVILDGRGELTLAPNPIRTGNLLATFAPLTETAAVRVINMSGQVMQSQQLAPFNEQIFVNTSNLRPGIYILQIISGNDIQTSRFIKK